MDIKIDEAIFTLAPGFVRYVVVARNVENKSEDPALLALLRAEESNVRENDAFVDIKSHPRLSAWRELFLEFGVNPNKCPPSVANLVKRVKSGKELPFVNSLVCIFNIVSLRYTIPAGGDDLSIIKGDICLQKATGSEIYIPLGSTRDSDAVEHPASGEVILVDTGDATVLCRAWCWKNGDTTKITPETKNVAINLDILTPLISKEEGAKIAAEVAKLIHDHCGASSAIYMLDKDSKSITPN